MTKNNKGNKLQIPQRGPIVPGQEARTKMDELTKRDKAQMLQGYLTQLLQLHGHQITDKMRKDVERRIEKAMDKIEETVL